MNQLNLAFAFGAGVLATVNPCGWAMLPSFVSYYLGSQDPGYVEKALGARILEGLRLGLVVTAGFLVIFGLAGVVISAGLRTVVQYMPLAAVAVGIALALLGAWLLTGKSLPLALPALRVEARTRSAKSVFLFGVAYAFASLSCTLPIFLAIIATSLTAAGPMGIFLVFGAYALGMAVVLMTVALSSALLKETVAHWARPLLPHVHRLGAALLVVAGLYLIWYQGRYIPLVLAGL